jgi:15-cis-phytoene synthase
MSVAPLATSADWKRCEETARQHGRTFFLASRFLPPDRRRAILATYAFCRTADDIVDRAPQSGLDGCAIALRQWEDEITNPRDPIAVAFSDARSQFGIPSEAVHDLFTGIRMDLDRTRYATWNDLREYCYFVAGTVGVMVAPILGCREPAALTHAADLGIAMQLTNILRDVAEDADRGRLYLPLDEIADFGCDPDSILAGRPGHRFPALIAFQIRRARDLYASAERGVETLVPSGRLATLAASRLYAGILSEIEDAGYDVFCGRAYVSHSRKAMAMPGIAAAVVRLSIPLGRTTHWPADGEFRHPRPDRTTVSGLTVNGESAPEFRPYG